MPVTHVVLVKSTQHAEHIHALPLVVLLAQRVRSIPGWDRETVRVLEETEEVDLTAVTGSPASSGIDCARRG